MKVEEAPGKPFDRGRFALLLEALDGSGEPVLQEPPPPRTASEIVRATKDRVPPTLTLCRGCEQYVHPGTETCPFCSGDVGALAAAWEDREQRIAAAAARVQELMAKLNASGVQL